MISDNMVWGIEIEFAAPDGHNIRAEINQQSLRGPWSRWECGTDYTAMFDGKNGLELRNSRPFSTNDEEVWVQLEAILKFIKSRGCHVHGKCGVHIHFSRPNGFARCRLGFVKRNLAEIFSNHIKSFRRNYCTQETGKYQILRRVAPRRYEARIFNGTIKIRAIKNYWNVLKNLIDSEITS